MAAHAEARFEDAVRNRVAQQELADALAVLVEIIDRAVFGVLEAVKARLRIAETGVDVEQFGILGRLTGAVGDGEEGFETVGRPQLRLEIDIAGEQLDDQRRHILGHAVGKRGAIDAVIDARQVLAGGGAKELSSKAVAMASSIGGSLPGTYLPLSSTATVTRWRVPR